MKLNLADARIAWITRREIDSGEAHPSNHDWGTDYLFSLGAARVATRRVKWIDKWGEKLRLGPNVSEQVWLFLNRRKYDFIIAKDTDLITILCGLLWLIRQRKTMFAYLHFPLRRSIKDFFLVQRCSIFLALSERIRSLSVITSPEAADRLLTLRWGVDLEFYDSVRRRLSAPCNPDSKLKVLLIGITGRKFTAVVNALGDDQEIQVRVLTSSPDVMRRIADLPNFSSVREDLRTPVSYQQLVAEYLVCDVVAVPLDIRPASDAQLIRQRATLWGITTLLEASALGKPVVMTFNPVIDFDVAGEECGLIMRTDDAESWREAIRWCKTSRTILPTMGARARSHVEANYGMRYFQKKLRLVIDNYLKGA